MLINVELMPARNTTVARNIIEYYCFDQTTNNISEFDSTSFIHPIIIANTGNVPLADEIVFTNSATNLVRCKS